MFNRLTKQFLKDAENRRKDNAFYIANGYMKTWASDNKVKSDNGIRRYSTDTRWIQYQTGKIDRKKAVELAVKRMNRQLDADIQKGLARIQAVENAPELVFAYVNVEFIRSRTWGYNPRVESHTDNGVFYGTASGCGYDKESAGVADAFNNDLTMLKVLYTLKEAGLKAGKTSASATACTGHDNRNIIGYGAGYSVLPYFEGGVGVDCFWAILKKAGYTVSTTYGKHENHYRIERA